MRELEITVEILFPLFLLLALGWVLRRIGWMSAQLTRETNKLIFQLFLPVLVFNNIRDMASGVSMDAGYAAYLFFGLLGIYLLAAVFVPGLKSIRKSAALWCRVFSAPTSQPWAHR